MISFCIFQCPNLDPAITGAITGGIISVVGFFLISYWQTTISRKSQFEVTFFNLLASIRTLVHSIKGDMNYTSKAMQRMMNTKEGGYKFNAEDYDDGKTAKGTDFFEKASDTLAKYIKDYMTEISFELESISNESEKLEFKKSKIIEAYDDFFDNHASQLGHYFRYVFNVIKYVDDSKNITNEDKKTYVNFIQAQMSSAELALLFYNGKGQWGEKFNYYMAENKYNDFLQNVHGEDIYEHRAFMPLLYPGHKFRAFD